MALGVPFGEGRGAHTQGPSPFPEEDLLKFKAILAVLVGRVVFKPEEIIPDIDLRTE